MSNRIKSNEFNMTVPTYSLYHTMLLWLVPVGIIAGIINGFTFMHILAIVSGVVHFLIALYMLLHNTLLHNVIQLLLSASYSGTVIYFALDSQTNGKLSPFGMVNFSVESISILCIIVAILFLVFKKK